MLSARSTYSRQTQEPRPIKTLPPRRASSSNGIISMNSYGTANHSASSNPRGRNLGGA